MTNNCKLLYTNNTNNYHSLTLITFLRFGRIQVLQGLRHSQGSQIIPDQQETINSGTSFIANDDQHVSSVAYPTSWNFGVSHDMGWFRMLGSYWIEVLLHNHRFDPVSICLQLIQNSTSNGQLRTYQQLDSSRRVLATDKITWVWLENINPHGPFIPSFFNDPWVIPNEPKTLSSKAQAILQPRWLVRKAHPTSPRTSTDP